MHFDDFLRQACPHFDLVWRKYRRRSARRRVEARLDELGLADYADYLKILTSNPQEAARFANLMRVTVSRFFREGERWQILQQQVLPALVMQKEPDKTLQAWSAGCCGGEEPYTLALVWLAAIQNRFPESALEILATDIDQRSLERARRARYAAGSLREVPEEDLTRYFSASGDCWQPVPAVRGMVSFRRHDLLQDELPTGFDLICCRYLVFTYYRGLRLERTVQRLWQALAPGGALMIGRKEAPGPAAELFEAWPDAPGVWRKKATAT